MTRPIIIALAVALGIVAGGLPLARAASAWVDMGEADNVKVWRFTDGGHVCYVSSTGGISCPK